MRLGTEAHPHGYFLKHRQKKNKVMLSNPDTIRTTVHRLKKNLKASDIQSSFSRVRVISLKRNKEASKKSRMTTLSFSWVSLLLFCFCGRFTSYFTASNLIDLPKVPLIPVDS